MLRKKDKSIKKNNHHDECQVCQVEEREKPLFTHLRFSIIILIMALSWFKVFKSYLPFDISLIGIIFGGFPLYKAAYKDLKSFKITAEVFMTMGILAATIIGEFLSALVIAFFMLIAFYLDELTTDRARHAINELIELSPKSARIRQGDKEVEVPVDNIGIGDIVIVRSGEKIPVDGKVIKGQGLVNQSSITGESIAVEKVEGDSVFAGTINELGLILVETTKVGKDSTILKIIELMEKAESSKAPVQRVADRFTSIFTPIILIAALFTYLVTKNFIYSISVIVVACPCAIALATPLAMVASLGKAARKGIIVKGGIYLENLAKIKTLIMDKTGTVTLGEPEVIEIRSFDNHQEKEILALAALTEKYSEHPLSKAIIKKAQESKLEISEPENFKVIKGKGVIASDNGKRIILGNRELLADYHIIIIKEVEDYMNKVEDEGKTPLIIGHDEEVCGVIVVADVVRENASSAIKELKEMGIKKLIMLTGDNPRTASSIAEKVKVNEVYAEMLPQEKMKKVEELVKAGEKIIMVGDGINDAPALALADVGIAMGVAGSDVAIEAADVVLMKDDWAKIPEVIKIGQRTFRVIKQNLAIGIIFNLVGVTLASLGILTPIMAAIAHLLPDVAVFSNSSKLFKGD